VTVRASQSKAVFSRASSQPSSSSDQHKLPCRQSTVPDGAADVVVVNWPPGAMWSSRYAQAVATRASSPAAAPSSARAISAQTVERYFGL
jgi:hypothetical protein